MRSFSKIDSSIPPIKCHQHGCRNQATWLMSQYLLNYLLCDEHKSTESYAATVENSPTEELQPVVLLIQSYEKPEGI